MLETKLGFNTELLPMFMVREAVRTLLGKKDYKNLEQLHFTSLTIKTGVAEPQSAITRNQAGAALLRENPKLEITQAIVVEAELSTFNGSVYTVKAQCNLYRHVYSHDDLCHPESIALTFQDSESDEGYEEYFFRFNSYYTAARIRHIDIEQETGLTEKEKVKLAIISTDVLPDHFVEQKVLDLELHNEADVEEIIGCLLKHRPAIAQRWKRITQKHEVGKK